ncbi:MAG: cysteine desulfurase family protein [Myxococcota bacterium]|nr:cysteine desulfurase family protein [Myxococcota bacterium]
MSSPAPQRIYLDANASAPLCAEARRAMLSCLDSEMGNPSSVHAEGRQGRAALAAARRQVVEAIDGASGDLVFTSSATEANNLALKGVGLASPRDGRRGLITTAAEHPSVLEPLRWLSGAGHDLVLDVLPVDEDGRVSRERLSERLGDETLLVSVIAANNETGAVSPISDIAKWVHEAGALFHVDAAQALGRIPVSVRDWGADLVTFSSHKVGGPRGAGALWVRSGLHLDPIHHGGHQERNRRGGTEAVVTCVGFGAACENAAARRSEMGDRIGPLRDRLWHGILELCPGAQRLSPVDGCLPNTLLAAFPGVQGEALLMGLDMEGIAVSTGSACTAGSLEPSHVLLAMGLEAEIARSAVRFSLGLEVEPEAISRTLEVLGQLVPRLEGAR